ncbi:hypothetical protein ACRRVB_04070 [Candidatus Cardinium hertigii]|uniref:hypothetical protein n=1 Tax=Candidatus Cardinium hertigii TaxID=247481 RepID=UPI003D7C40D0
MNYTSKLGGILAAIYNKQKTVMSCTFNTLKSIKKGLISSNILFSAVYLLFSAEVCTRNNKNRSVSYKTNASPLGWPSEPVPSPDAIKGMEPSAGNGDGSVESLSVNRSVVSLPSEALAVEKASELESSATEVEKTEAALAVSKASEAVSAAKKEAEVIAKASVEAEVAKKEAEVIAKASVEAEVAVKALAAAKPVVKLVASAAVKKEAVAAANSVSRLDGIESLEPSKGNIDESVALSSKKEKKKRKKAKRAEEISAPQGSVTITNNYEKKETDKKTGTVVKNMKKVKKLWNRLGNSKAKPKNSPYSSMPVDCQLESNINRNQVNESSYGHQDNRKKKDLCVGPLVSEVEITQKVEKNVVLNHSVNMGPSVDNSLVDQVKLNNATKDAEANKKLQQDLDEQLSCLISLSNGIVSTDNRSVDEANKNDAPQGGQEDKVIQEMKDMINDCESYL